MSVNGVTPLCFFKEINKNQYIIEDLEIVFQAKAESAVQSVNQIKSVGSFMKT